MEVLAKWLELAVGFSLVAVGLMGLREVNEELHKKHKKIDDPEDHADDDAKGLHKSKKKSDLDKPLSSLYTGVIQGSEKSQKR